MLKKIIYFSILSISLLKLTLVAAEPSPVICSAELQPVFNKIWQLPEAREVIAEIQKEGQFRIVANHHPLSQQFGAYWDYEHRAICVNVAHHQDQGEIIGSIIFEMQNALTTKKYDQLDNMAQRNQIDRESYIRSVEYQEFINSHNAASLARKGIAKRLFPSNSELPTFKTFDEHYRMQQYGGHSEWIGRAYDQLSN